jgi:hypothetical protein
MLGACEVERLLCRQIKDMKLCVGRYQATPWQPRQL